MSQYNPINILNDCNKPCQSLKEREDKTGYSNKPHTWQDETQREKNFMVNLNEKKGRKISLEYKPQNFVSFMDQKIQVFKKVHRYIFQIDIKRRMSIGLLVLHC